MKERAVLFGRTNSLVGVVTEPERPISGGTQPAAILLNAGLIHRVGPNRINVQIARRLAASGFPVMRLDLAGIGDSENRTDDLSLKDGIVSDAKEAMDFFAREEGARQFIVMGICSGANNSLRIAANDARVIGAVPIEPYHFSTPAYHFYYFSRRLLDLRCWRRALTMKSDFWGILRNKIGGGNAYRANRGSGRAAREQGRALKSQILSEVQGLLSRDINLHFVYCVDSPSYYNHYLPLRKQAVSCPQFRVSLFTNTDHTFTSLASQNSLVNSIDEWVKAAVKPASRCRDFQNTPNSIVSMNL